ALRRNTSAAEEASDFLALCVRSCSRDYVGDLKLLQRRKYSGGVLEVDVSARTGKVVEIVSDLSPDRFSSKVFLRGFQIASMQLRRNHIIISTANGIRLRGVWRGHRSVALVINEKRSEDR